MVVHGQTQEAPDRDEIAFKMRYIEGKTWKEIGQALNMSESSIKRCRRRANQKFKLSLKIMALLRVYPK